MAATDRGLSIRAYAKHRREHGLRGGTVSAVQRALASGRIPRNKHGKIDPQQADQAWEERTDSGRGRGRGGPGGTVSAPTVPGAPDYNVSRAIREAYAARRARLEYERMAESLVEAEAVRAEAFDLARSVRDAMNAIPARLAPLLVSETDEARIKVLLEEELRTVQSLLAQTEE